uniref:Uncharacterized protein n=2 Tax=Tetraselmis sp. GSL018 TaxID=582737 RepID=A0A061S0T7_9CHLO
MSGIALSCPKQEEDAVQNAFPSERICHMLQPGATVALVKVAALNAERLVSQNPGGLLEGNLIPLLVWQLGAQLEASQPWAALQVSRALLAVAAGGPELQAAVARTSGGEMLLSAVQRPGGLDLSSTAAAALGNLCANNPEVKARLRGAGAVRAVLQLMKQAIGAGDHFAAGLSAAALHNITNGDLEGAAEAIELDAAPLIVEAVAALDAAEEYLEQVVALVDSLSRGSAAARAAFGAAGGVRAVVRLLGREPPPGDPLLRTLTACLWSLARGDQAIQAAALEAGALPPVMAIASMTAPAAAEARHNAVGILCTMAVSERVSAEVCSSGALTPLVQALRPGACERTQSMVLEAILRMAEPEADPMRDHLCKSGVVPSLLAVLKERGHDDPFSLGILKALLDILDRNHSAQLLFCEAGGVGLLVEIMMKVFKPGGCEHPAMGDAAMAICHLADELEGAVYLRSMGAATLLVRSIMSGPHNPRYPVGPVILPAVAAIGRMAVHSEEIRREMLDREAVKACISLLKAGIDDVTENTCIMTLTNLSEGPKGQEDLRREGGMEFFSRILRMGATAEAAMDSVTAIGHMALNNPENQGILRQSKAFEGLTRIIDEVHGNSEHSDMEEAALVALVNLLRGNEENQAYVGPACGAQAITQVLKDGMAYSPPSRRTKQAVLQEIGGLRAGVAEASARPPSLPSREGLVGSEQATQAHSAAGPHPLNGAATPRQHSPVRRQPAEVVCSPRLLRSRERPPQVSSAASPDGVRSLGTTGVVLDRHGQLALEVLSLCCQKKENSDALLKSGAIPLLVKFISGAQDAKTKRLAAACLAHLAQYSEENQQVMSSEGALDALVETLDGRFSSTMDAETRKWVCVALSHIVCSNPSNQERVGATGIEAIISVVQHVESSETRALAMEALSNLVDSEINQGIIATLGGVQSLLATIGSEDPSKPLVRSALVTLKKLSVQQQIREIASRHSAAKTLVAAASRGTDSHGNGESARLACEVAAELLVEDGHKEQARRDGVIAEVVKFLRLPADGEVTCAATKLVGRLLEGSVRNRREFRKCLGMRPLVRLLTAGPNEPITSTASTVVAILAEEKENKEVLRNSGAFDNLMPLLRAAPGPRAAISAARAMQRLCVDHYMNQNCAREAGLIEEAVRLLGIGHGKNELVAAAAGAIAAACSSGNITSIEAFRAAGGLEKILEFIEQGLTPVEGSEIASCLASVTEPVPGMEAAVQLEEVVGPLVGLLANGADHPAAGQALNALASLCNKREAYKKAVVRAGAVPQIVELLQEKADDPSSLVARHGARLLDYLLADEEHSNKVLVRRAGGLTPMLKLLRRAEDRALCLSTASAVGYLCYGEPDTAVYLVRGHGVAALCRLVRQEDDPQVTAAALWALRIASVAPAVVLDLIAAEQGLKHCIRILSLGEPSDTATHAAFLFSQFAMEKKHHPEIFERRGVEHSVPYLKFATENYELKTYLVRALCGLAATDEGRQEIRRMGGVGTLVGVLERDGRENGLYADITVFATEALWQLSFDRICVLRMKDAGVIPLLIRMAEEDPNTISGFHCLCSLSVISELEGCRQDIVDAGGLRLFISMASVISQHKVNSTAAMALRNFCDDARLRQHIRTAGGLKSLCRCAVSSDVEAALEALLTVSRLVREDGKPAVSDLIKAGTIESIKSLFDGRPAMPETISTAQEILRLIQGTWEGKRVIWQQGAQFCLDANPEDVATVVSSRKIQRRPSQVFGRSSLAPSAPSSTKGRSS